MNYLLDSLYCTKSKSAIGGLHFFLHNWFSFIPAVGYIFNFCAAAMDCAGKKLQRSATQTFYFFVVLAYNSKVRSKDEYRNYVRARYVGTTVAGKAVRLLAPFKRTRPTDECCELCGLPAKRLDYHHWRNDNPSAGLWLCKMCHHFAERADADLLDLYDKLKESAIREVERAKLKARVSDARRMVGGVA